MEQVDNSHAELEHLLEVGEAHDSYATLARFIDPVDSTIAALEVGDVDRARALVRTEVESSYMNLVASLDIEQESIQTAIEENSAAGKALNGWVVFLLTLGVPGSAVAVYFMITRRRVRALKERNRVDLEAESAIGRAKDEFIAGLSHELRTPLTSIYGFAEILTDDVQGVEATQETAQIIANEAAEMTRMVDDLLAASRLESTGIEIDNAPTRLQDVVEAAITPFERAGMTIKREPTTAMATTDGARLRHVLINLISNAARHGGPMVGVEVSPGEDWVDIEVWDNGPGVPDGKVEKLYDRFIHNGEAPLLTGSVGLGLAVASRLTGLMGGKLQYQRFGGTTYFVVTLPLAAQDAEGEEPEESIASVIKTLST